MTTEAISAFGVILSRGEGAVPIAEITNIDGVQINRETIDVTSHDSEDAYREYIPSLKDTAEIAIEGNFIAGDTEGQLGLQEDLEDGTPQSFVLTFPPAIDASWSFTAYVTAFKTGGFPVDGKLAFSATLKVSGKPELLVSGS
jgi:predicted secreted protein